MKKLPYLLGVFLILLLAQCGSSDSGSNRQTESKKIVKSIESEGNQSSRDNSLDESAPNIRSVVSDAMQAHITTPKGKIVLNLAFQKAPVTVANFVGLAEGEIDNKARDKGVPYFDGLTFHRVAPNFVIQGGDPEARGTGGPGYMFQDEFHPDLLHDRPGTLSMANGRKDGNGSQYFITHRPIPNLNGKHSVFGYISEGMEVVNAISQGDEMTSIRIIRNTPEAKAFNAVEIFDSKAKLNTSK